MGKWVVCSAWPYVNAVPHLGTLIGSVLSADVYARYLRLRGEKVVFVSGSDEHGTPIEVEARKRGIEPKKLTDKMHEYVKSLFEKIGISFSNYTRTETPTHIEFVREFLMKIYNNGYIFTQEIEMPYCPKDKIYLPDRFIIGKCPYCGYPHAKGDQCEKCGRLLEPTQLIDPQCVFCGSKPEIRKTKHWYFDLPKLTEVLKKFIEEHPHFPDNVKAFCLNWIKEGLKPRAITRDNKWGIPAPFPGAEDKTIYVWFDALLGYLSATKEYGEKIGKPDLWKEYWLDKDTKTIYFIGKDNIPFHAIILPAMLIATGEDYTLPWQVAATEYLTFEGEKFSKSRGIGVWIDEALELMEPDYWRFALIYMRPEVRDSNFTWKEFYKIVNSELNDVIGNFIHRVLSFTYKNYNGTVPKPGELTKADLEFKEKIVEARENAAKFMDNNRLKLALNEVINVAREGNAYLNNKAPWDTIKTKPEDAATTMWAGVNSIKSLAILLEPFIPFSAERIWKLLNLPGSVHEQKWSNIGEFDIPPGHKINKPKPVFRKLPPDFTKRINETLRKVRTSLKRPEVLK